MKGVWLVEPYSLVQGQLCDLEWFESSKVFPYNSIWVRGTASLGYGGEQKHLYPFREL